MAGIDDDPDLKLLLGQKPAPAAPAAVPGGLAPAGVPPPAAQSAAPAAPAPAPVSGWRQYLPSMFSTPAADQPGAFAQNNQPPSLGQASIFEKPANASMQDYLLAHLAEASKGAGQIGQAGEDYARVAANTYGLGDRALAAVTGTDLAMERARTQQASERLGPEVSFAANLTGGGPIGRAAGAVGLGAGPASLGLQGAGAGYLGALGRGDEDPTSAAVTGGLTGVGLGTLGNVVGPYVGKLASHLGPTAEDAMAAAQGQQAAAEKPLESMVFKPPAADQAYRYGVRVPPAGDLPSVFQPGPNVNTSAADINANLQWLKGLKPDEDPGGGGATVATRLARNLAERAPIDGTPGQAMPAIDAANAAAQRAQGAQKLEQWTRQKGSEQIQKEASAAADAAPAGSLQRKAYQAIANAPSGGAGGFYEQTVIPALSAAGSLVAGNFVPGIGHLLGAGVGAQLGKWGGQLLPGTAPLHEALARAWQPIAGQTTGAAQGLQAQSDLRRALQTLNYGQAGRSLF